MSIRKNVLLLLSLLTTFAYYQNAIAASPTQHPFVITGVVVNSGNAKLVHRFVQLLTKQTGYPMKLVFAASYAELSDVLKRQPDAIGWTCGAPFVEDHQSYGQQLIVVPLFQGEPHYSSVVLTRRTGNERTLSDFKGKVLAYSDPRSNSGYFVPAYALREKGININEYFRLLINAGNHERSIEAVLGGLADVAAVDEYVWVEYLKYHPEAGKALREVERFGPFPFTPIVAGPAVKQADIENIRRALVSLSSVPEGKSILASFGLDGFVEKPVAFYAPIESILMSIDPKTDTNN